MKYRLPYNPVSAVHRMVYAAAMALLSSIFFAIADAAFGKSVGVGGVLMFLCGFFGVVYWLETRRVKRRLAGGGNTGEAGRGLRRPLRQFAR